MIKIWKEGDVPDSVSSLVLTCSITSKCHHTCPCCLQPIALEILEIETFNDQQVSSVNSRPSMSAPSFSKIQNMCGSFSKFIFGGVQSALTSLQAQQPSAAAARGPQVAPAFGRSLSRGLSRASGESSPSDSTQERAAAEAAAFNDQPVASTSSKGRMFGMAVGVWRKATSKLFDLEAKIANQVGCKNRNPS